MSSGRHAGFMAGEEEGVPAAGDPRHRDGCLRGFPEVWTPPPNLGGLGWLRLRGAGLRTWRGKGREGRHGGCWVALGCVQLAHSRCARDTAFGLWPARDYFGK